jgi:predicted esterase YcpF (UPF0227 family)
MRQTVVYLHGFRSAPASTKARLLATAIAAQPEKTRPEYLVPDLSHRPRDAVARVMSLLAGRDGEALTLVGSSLGGFYATHIAERIGCRGVMINPAIHPDRSLEPYLGEQTNLYTGRRFEVTREHFSELAALRVPRITLPQRYYLLVQSGDDLLDWRESVAYFAGAWQRVEGGGDHAFVDFARVIGSILAFASRPRG